VANKSSEPKTIAKILTVKFVKRANAWVATFPKDGKTAHEWFDEKPTEEQLNNIKDLMT
jgi:hypothetical protein